MLKYHHFTSLTNRKILKAYSLDYIFTRGFVTLEIGRLPEIVELGCNGIPSQWFPSDHIILTASLTLSINEKL